MDIGFAVDELKAGRRVRRADWSGRNIWLSLTPGQRIPASKFWSVQNMEFAQSQPDHHVEVLSYVTMKTVDDKIVPWLCSQTDLLATDWEVVS
jgi:hypothetical protein